MKKVVFANLLIMCVLTCSKTEITYPYYQFTNENYEYIPSVYNEIGKIIRFQNQFGDEIELEIVTYKITKEWYNGLFNSGSSEPSHYYQLLTIELKVTTDEVIGTDCDLKTIQISNWGGDFFVTRMSFKNAPDPCMNENSTLRLEFPYETYSMNFNSHNYNKVVTIFEDLDIFFNSKNSFDRIYFDFKEGIIGFDDTQNNIQYRIVND